MSAQHRHDPVRLAAGFRRVRALTEALADPLEHEDQCVQSMPDASPTKWHLAHTSWFFSNFVLDQRYQPGWDFLFNSYYQTVGPMHARLQRGLLSRPTVTQVADYRRWVDERVLALLERDAASPAQLALIELGLHHEQQHQELILTDIKHLLGLNPLAPRYRDRAVETGESAEAPALRWIEDPGGLVQIGRDLEHEFAFDNEGPRHKQWLEPFAIASRPATCAEYLAFMADRGYQRPELWLAEGWDTVAREGWRAPAYWIAAPESVARDRGESSWRAFTLDGVRELDLHAPVCHLSYYEADAFARWSDARLPSEAEWERLAEGLAPSGNLLPIDPDALASAALHPRASAAPSDPISGLTQLFGDVWEWTASPYAPYPGFRPAAGAVGEYNGKFMCNQLVLRGGSCATPADHIRASYRNFFHAPSRWQFTGVRLARDL
jgi:ergothioneine biosynthesis protein EgtB